MRFPAIDSMTPDKKGELLSAHVPLRQRGGNKLIGLQMGSRCYHNEQRQELRLPSINPFQWCWLPYNPTILAIKYSSFHLGLYP